MYEFFKKQTQGRFTPTHIPSSHAWPISSTLHREILWNLHELQHRLSWNARWKTTHSCHHQAIMPANQPRRFQVYDSVCTPFLVKFWRSSGAQNCKGTASGVIRIEFQRGFCWIEAPCVSPKPRTVWVCTFVWKSVHQRLLIKPDGLDEKFSVIICFTSVWWFNFLVLLPKMRRLLRQLFVAVGFICLLHCQGKTLQRTAKHLQHLKGFEPSGRLIKRWSLWDVDGSPFRMFDHEMLMPNSQDVVVTPATQSTPAATTPQRPLDDQIVGQEAVNSPSKLIIRDVMDGTEVGFIDFIKDRVVRARGGDPGPSDERKSTASPPARRPIKGPLAPCKLFPKKNFEFVSFFVSRVNSKILALFMLLYFFLQFTPIVGCRPNAGISNLYTNSQPWRYTVIRGGNSQPWDTRKNCCGCIFNKFRHRVAQKYLISPKGGRRGEVRGDEMKQRLAWNRGIPMASIRVPQNTERVGTIASTTCHWFTPNAVSSPLLSFALPFCVLMAV